MVQEIKLNQIDSVVTTVGTPWTDDNLPTEKAVRDAIGVASSPYTTVTAKTAWVDYQAWPTGWLLVVSALQTVSWVGVRQIVSDVGPIPTTQVATFQLHEIGEWASMSAPILPNEYYKVNGAAETILFYE